MKTKKSKIKRGKNKEGRLRKNNNLKIWKWFGWLGGVILLLLIIPVFIFYSGFGRKFADRLNFIYEKLPLPVARVGTSGALITSREWLQDFDSVKQFYNSRNFSSQGKRIDFSTKQGQLRLQIKKKDILDKLIEDKIIMALAKKNGITVSKQEVDEAVQQSLEKSGGNYQELILNLKASYGWSLDDFKNKVVKNQLYAKKLFQWYQKNIPTTKQYKQAQVIKNKIIQSQDGQDNFSDIVEKFSEGDSAKNDGNLNWMSENQIIPEVLAGIRDLKKGEISDIIVSPLGMHIVKIKDVREIKDDQSSRKEYKLQQIFIRGVSFVDWLRKIKSGTEVKIFIGKYKWDRNKGEVVFSNQQLRRREGQIRRESEGDPSL